MAEGPESGDRGELAGLRGRPDLNGRRVEVKGPAAGADGAPRLAVRLLFGAGAGTMMKVKAANLELDKARDTLATAMQALAPGADPEEWRDWAGGLPALVLGKVVETLIAQDKAVWAAGLKQRNPDWTDERIQERTAKRKQDGNCLFVFAMVCKQWRKAQQKGGAPLRSRSVDMILPGSVALAKWALAEGCPREAENGYHMARYAAMFGHMELMVWLIRERGFAMDEGVMANAAGGGNLELVRWLRGEGCVWGRSTCFCAAGRGRLGVLQWLRANGCPWDAETCKCAAFNGQLGTLRWARENGCDWNTDACSAAAQNGRLEVLQWLRANGCPWNDDTCHAAAQYGHLETLRWARENGCECGEAACLNAAGGGQLEILQWLRAESCPWNGGTCFQAVEKGHVEVLRWARANGCEWDAETRDRAAAELGYTDDFGNLLP